MKNMLFGFEEFSRRFRLVEAEGSGGSGTACFIAASNKAEFEGQQRFITEVSMMDPEQLDSLLNSIIAKGKGQLAAFDGTWQKRIEAGLDEGPLTKKGKWYVGKGAWRINSAKANQLGMAPKGVQYWDPMQRELLEKYFGEDYGKSDVTVSPSGEIKGLAVDKEKEMMPSDQELVTTESLKYLKKMYEEDEFTLGPPESAKNAVVVDTNELVEQLVDNFFLETRDNVMIWGAPGIGKTEVIKSVGKAVSARLGKPVPVIVITLATKAAYDIAGIPILFSKSGTGETVLPSDLRGQVGMDFAYPAWLPPPEDDQEGILFFDEINRADVDVMGAALTLLLDRVSGSYRMPDGWRIWAAGNRDMDGPVKPFEGAMASRFLGGHFHLVPTVESWADWARSDKAFFKGTQEWYIPDELLSFFKLKDVSSVSKKGQEGMISNLGRQFRVKFTYFYNWDAAAAASTGGGKMEGFPNPRTWAKACQNIYQKLRAIPNLMAQVPPDVDPRRKVISAFGLAMLNPKLAQDIVIKMSAIVGSEAVDAFVQFSKQMAKLNDSNGTLVQKIENIYMDPAKPRALLDIDKLGADEIFGVLDAVEGKFDDLVSSKEMKTPELFNWMKYVLDLGKEKKASQGEITQHVSAVLEKHPLTVRPLTQKTNPEITPDRAAIITEFSKQFKELGSKIANL